MDNDKEQQQNQEQIKESDKDINNNNNADRDNKINDLVNEVNKLKQELNQYKQQNQISNNNNKYNDLVNDNNVRALDINSYDIKTEYLPDEGEQEIKNLISIYKERANVPGALNRFIPPNARTSTLGQFYTFLYLRDHIPGLQKRYPDDYISKLDSFYNIRSSVTSRMLANAL